MPAYNRIDSMRDFQEESQLVRLRNDKKKKKPASASAGLATLFRPPFELMFSGSFQEAKLVAREQKRWLLINIQVIIPREYKNIDTLLHVLTNSHHRKRMNLSHIG